MKIKISKNWWSNYVRGQYGKTQAEKETRAEMIWSSLGRSWAKGMNKARALWVDVETEFLFEDQFNVAEPNLRVDYKLISGIDFKPEFKNIDEFQEAVQKRYDKDWPGSKITCQAIRSYIKSGFIKVV